MDLAVLFHGPFAAILSGELSLSFFRGGAGGRPARARQGEGRRRGGKRGGAFCSLRATVSSPRGKHMRPAPRFAISSTRRPQKAAGT